MGTHGRIAVTLNGIHTCCEQTMDGHEAAWDMIEPFLRKDIENDIPLGLYPSMSDDSVECDQDYFGHIDYDHKILYISYERWFMSMKERINYLQMKKAGWRIAWGIMQCPSETKCVNCHTVEWGANGLQRGKCVYSQAKLLQDGLANGERARTAIKGKKIRRKDIPQYYYFFGMRVSHEDKEVKI